MSSDWLFLSAIPSLYYPLVCYSYFRDLQRRSSEIENLLGGTILKKSLKAYGAGSPQELFEKFHDWKSYILPVCISMAVVAFFSIATLTICLTRLGGIRDLTGILLALGNLPGAAIAGFAGAYVWSHYDIITRYKGSDLTSASMNTHWLRLLVGTTMGYFFSLALIPPFHVMVAFGLGAFPLDTVRDLLRQFTKNKVQIPLGTGKAEEPNLHLLQGTTIGIIERLKEEGIESTHHLAFANPVELLMNTNIEWKVILDLIDQAILHTYVGEKITSLRTMAVRTAIEVAEVKEYLSSDDHSMREVGNQLVALLSDQMGTHEPGIRKLIDTIHGDPQVNFIWDLWIEAFGMPRRAEI